MTRQVGGHHTPLHYTLQTHTHTADHCLCPAGEAIDARDCSSSNNFWGQRMKEGDADKIDHCEHQRRQQQHNRVNDQAHSSLTANLNVAKEQREK